MGPGGKGKGLMQQMSKQMGNSRGAMNPHNMQMNIQQMSRMLPPNVCSTSLTQPLLYFTGHWSQMHSIHCIFRSLICHCYLYHACVCSVCT